MIHATSHVHAHYPHFLNYLRHFYVIGMGLGKFPHQSISFKKLLSLSRNLRQIVHRQIDGDVKEKVLSLIETPLFDFSIEEASCLRSKSIHPRIRNIFAANGAILSLDAQIRIIDGNKWTIWDSDNSYNIRRWDDSFSVFLELRTPYAYFLRILGKVYYFFKDDLGGYRYSVKRCIAENLSILKYSFRKKFIDKPEALMVNIGSGTWYEKNWKILDYAGNWYTYPRYFMDYQHDLMSLRKFPFSDASVRLFYSEHVLEHFPDGNCIHIFKEIHRSLVSGGGLRIVVPDADLIYEMLLQEDQKFFEQWIIRENVTIMEAFLILVAHPRSPVDEVEARNNVLTMSKEELFKFYSEKLEYDYNRAGEHINWFTYEKLEKMLKEAGFAIVNKTNAQESTFEQIRGDGFDTRASYSLHVDAIKT